MTSCYTRTPQIQSSHWLLDGSFISQRSNEVKGLWRGRRGTNWCGQEIRCRRSGDVYEKKLKQEMLPDGLNPVVTEVMNRNVYSLSEDDSIREAILKFLNCGISGAPVLREDGKLVGVLSESDIITRETGCKLEVANGGNECSLPHNVSLFQQFIQDFRPEKLDQLLDSKVKHIMTQNPITVNPSSTVFFAAKKMIDNKINRVPVVEQGEVVGILTRGDLLQCMIWELLVAGNNTNSVSA